MLQLDTIRLVDAARVYPELRQAIARFLTSTEFDLLVALLCCRFEVCSLSHLVERDLLVVYPRVQKNGISLGYAVIRKVLGQAELAVVVAVE